MATLGDQAIGAVVKIKEGGTLTNFIVLKRGYPVDNNGRTLLLREAIYDTRQWNSSGDSLYSSSTIDSWVNGTYINLIDDYIKGYIEEVAISSYRNSSSATKTVNRRAFLLSYTELGYPGGSYSTVEGEALAYFNSNARRVGYLNGIATRWWLRSSYGSSAEAWLVYTSGDRTSASCSYTYGSRPAFTLPDNMYISSDGTITKSPMGVWIKQSGTWGKAKSVWIKQAGAWSKV